MRATWKIIVLGFALAGPGHAGRARDLPDAAAVFGPQPVPVTISLGMSNDSTPPAPMAVRCFAYRGFTVKEIDLAEEGDDQISFISHAVGAAAPACRRANAPGEKILPQSEFDGYFWGAIGDDAFVLAADGDNGSLAFDVVRPQTGRVIATGVIDATATGATARPVPGGVALRFTTQFTASCSVAVDAGCAAAIEKQMFGEPLPLADCLQAYQRAVAADVARCAPGAGQAQCRNDARDDERNSPTVVNDPVVMTIETQSVTTRPAGPITRCLVSE